MGTLRKFEVSPAENGGFTVVEKTFMVPGEYPTVIAAFSNAVDMISWLAKQYDLQSNPHPFASGGLTTATGAHIVGEKPNEARLVPRAPPENDGWIKFDVTCDHAPVLPPKASVQADYGQGEIVIGNPEKVNWHRVLAYRLVNPNRYDGGKP